MAAGGVWRKAYGDQNKASEISAAVSLRASGEKITDSVKDMRMTVTALWHTGAQWPDRTDGFRVCGRRDIKTAGKAGGNGQIQTHGSRKAGNMEFRPCIDIHNGKVKQIVGGSLNDQDSYARENFVSKQDAAYFAEFYKKDGLGGGHVIMLNPPGSPWYEATKEQALLALKSYPGGLQAGGGITQENAGQNLDAGASHVIVTSYVFKDGRIHYDRLCGLSGVTGKKRLVLDISCRKKNGQYYIVTDRWQKFTKETISYGLLDELSVYADELLIHAADVEGKAAGIDAELVKLLGGWGKLPVTYAGGVSCFEDLKKIKTYGRDRLHVTIGSALDLFGGRMDYRRVLKYCAQDVSG